MSFTNPPPATAPKGGDFVSFAAFPESGPTVLTILAVNFIKDHQDTDRETGETRTFDALEWYLGAKTDAGPRFLKTWPAKYSIHEKSFFSKLYKAVKGTLPLAGINPQELVGGGVTGNLENEDKVSKKGKAYTRTKLAGITPVMKQLKGSITPAADLLPELTKAMLPPAKDGKAAAPADKEDAPF